MNHANNDTARPASLTTHTTAVIPMHPRSRKVPGRGPLPLLPHSSCFCTHTHPPLLLQDLAAAGSAPTVLHDCLRWLALRGLTTPKLFAAAAAAPLASSADKRKLAALRHLYDTGRRPLRSKSCRDKEPRLVRRLFGAAEPRC